jgi:hypothetical protein
MARKFLACPRALGELFAAAATFGPLASLGPRIDLPEDAPNPAVGAFIGISDGDPMWVPVVCLRGREDPEPLTDAFRIVRRPRTASAFS